METIKRPHGHNLVSWAKDQPRVLVLSADLTGSCEADDFREAYPDRFFSMGMAEQNMMGFASGLAREGFFPFVHTFAVFICRRAYDQVAMSIAYPNLPVRLLGFLPGITTPGGVTHQAIDDLALMRAVPNMNVLECGDATDVLSVLDVAHKIDGPVYIRMLRGDVPALFPGDSPMIFNRSRELSRGRDLTLISSGICTEEAIKARLYLNGQGIGVTHLHVSTIKPFTDPAILAALKEARSGIITLENHSVIGGLGSAVAELAAEAGLGKPLVRLGIGDRYAHGASREYLMRENAIDALRVVQAGEKLLGTSFGPGIEDLAASPPVPGTSPGADPERIEDL